MICNFSGPRYNEAISLGLKSKFQMMLKLLFFFHFIVKLLCENVEFGNVTERQRSVKILENIVLT